MAGCGLTKRRRWCLLERGDGRVVLMWRDGGWLKGIAWILSWPVHFASWTPAFRQNDRDKACVVCQVCTFTCPGSEFSSPPSAISSLSKQFYNHPSLQNTYVESVYLTPDSLSLSLSLLHTHTHTHARAWSTETACPFGAYTHTHTLSLSLSLSLSHIHTHTHTHTHTHSYTHTHTQVLRKDGKNGQVVG